MSRTIKEWMDEAYQTSKGAGWHDPEVEATIDKALNNIHGEISEINEELRKGHALTHTYQGPSGEPKGVPSEFADVLIRVFDTARQHGIDLDEALERKNAYNKTRPYRHGGKKYLGEGHEDVVSSRQQPPQQPHRAVRDRHRPRHRSGVRGRDAGRVP